ncbi:MAG: hypothetical protein CMD06_05935, partial [Flavobacteriales bacterium]|nr:hypothetical protein [Flavobacteriales bacterium]
MKNRSTNIFLSIFLLVSFQNISAQILAVPEIEQEQNQWCWSGVSKCILDYYFSANNWPAGSNQNQCGIAEYARTQNSGYFGGSNCCAFPTGSCNNPNWMYGVNGSIEDILSFFGAITTNNLTNSISESQWQNEINNNTP